MGILNDYKLKRDWNEVVNMLDDEYAFFLTHILNMGKPRWTEQLPTAAVGLPLDQNGNVVKDTDEFEFMFNPKFFEALTPESRMFITSHEGMHIILNHLKLSQADHFDDKQLFNIAADCVINDYLVESGMKAPEKAELEKVFGTKEANLMYGKEQVGYNCASRTVTEVYDDLKKKQNQQGGGGQGDPQQGQPQAGQGGGQGDYFEFDNHDWMHDPNFKKELEKAINEAIKNADKDAPGEIDQMRQDINYSSDALDGFRSPPGEGLGPEEEWAQVHGVSMAWTDLLKEVDPDLFRGKGIAPPPVPSYHKPRRKMGAYYPDIMLPVYRKNPNIADDADEKPIIAMFLDVSGSISQLDRKRFISLAKTVPTDKIELIAHTFTTEVRELDLENPRYNSGGTDFGCIQRYIKTVLTKDFRLSGKYPKAVIVVTDGEASFGQYRPTEQEAKSWYWLVTDGASAWYSDDWQKVGKNKPLREFAK